METRTKLLVATGAAALATTAVIGSGVLNSAAPAGAPTPTEAARFLTQATFGPTEATIAEVQSLGFSAWIDQQMALPAFSTLDYMNARDEQDHPGLELHQIFVESFWNGVATRPDQLRQRMQWALSQIFVISREHETLEFLGATGTGNFYDILARNAFGNFRTLLDEVTMNPMMGIFLSYIMNDKEDPATGRNPDENYAREIMQLMTIGTIRLKQDGTPLRDLAGRVRPTYSHDDIAGLAKVFTGMSWFSPFPDDGSFLSAPNAFTVPMIFYPNHHSTAQKSFLGRTIPASATPDPAGDVKIALDTLFAHPNVGPFIGKKLIQQFVTSNPTKEYVGRVAGVFNNNGQGVRGDLAAVVRAILLDPEARDTSAAQSDPNFGKLREPVIRLANWMRAFEATSDPASPGGFEVEETGGDNVLNQGVLDAPSVFNFWRFGYVPPHTKLGSQGLVAPEFQVVSELTTSAYVNFMQHAVGTGVGFLPNVFPSPPAVKSAYTPEVALAETPEALLDRLDLLLFYGQMPAGLRQQIAGAVASVAIPSGGTAAQIAAAKLNRAKLAIFLSMVSGEYLTQR